MVKRECAARSGQHIGMRSFMRRSDRLRKMDDADDESRPFFTKKYRLKRCAPKPVLRIQNALKIRTANQTRTHAPMINTTCWGPRGTPTCAMSIASIARSTACAVPERPVPLTPTSPTNRQRITSLPPSRFQIFRTS